MTAAPAEHLDGERLAWVDKAQQHVRPDRLRELVRALVERPSPTGQELAVAAWAVEQLRRGGAAAHVQRFGGAGSANAVGRLPGSGEGADLLLYAPIDTWTTGEPEQDLPWASPAWRADLAAAPVDDGPYVTGLGAGNPKGHAACVLAAVEAVAAAGIPLAGDLVAGFGGGGMPTQAPAGSAPGSGHGAGAWHLLEQGGTTDLAVIAKPGWTASHEEVGLAWVEVAVEGTHTYVGSRHRIAYRSALADAAAVVTSLERWAPRWAEQRTRGTCAPQVVVSAVDSGQTRELAGTPALVRVLLDVRLSPGTTAPEAVRAVRRQVAAVAAERQGMAARTRLIVSVPGSHTDPGSPVVRSAVAAWEADEQRSHAPATGTSGATDANVLRLRGVPTVRIGMPKVADPRVNHDFTSGMNSVDVREMERLTRLLVRVAVDLCTRPADEVLMSRPPVSSS